MKHVLLLSFLSMSMLPVNSQLGNIESNFVEPDGLSIGFSGESFKTGTQPDQDAEKMLAVVFRKQDVCRAELKDFPFDIQYNIVSATIYFSGTNFRNVETGYITSASLTPVKSLITRCAPGTMVVFDNVKVIGPDKVVRPIQGPSYLLR